MPSTSLASRRVLIAEDELLIALDLADSFERAGACILGPASSIDSALSILQAEADIQLAVLDLNLGGELAFPVAEALLERKIPIIFSTGYDDGLKMPQRFEHAIRLTKPVSGAAAVEIAKEMLFSG